MEVQKLTAEQILRTKYPGDLFSEEIYAKSGIH